MFEYSETGSYVRPDVPVDLAASLIETVLRFLYFPIGLIQVLIAVCLFL